MKATAFEFRFRLAIFFLIYSLGFWAPWQRYSASTSSVTSTWLELIGALASAHWLSLSGSTMLVTLSAIAAAFAGAALRLWATAFITAPVMQSGSMHAGRVVAGGPYRHVRNPLYLGSYLTALAVAILMPPQGAAFFLAAMVFFSLRLIFGEETYLASQLGEPYLAYLKQVPRLVPSISARVAPAAERPRWLEAMLAESFPISLAVCFAALAWDYNSNILTRALLICFGGSLVLRAVIPQRTTR